MMVLEGWQFRLAKELPIFDSVKVAPTLTLTFHPHLSPSP